ncbi:hypothetical protein C8R45DRAFT_1009022 [Mycena sanguinolenta]|nr:hypothetical protein C8R45DRAFT_1009022 [Mycena sanguinolenta]
MKATTILLQSPAKTDIAVEVPQWANAANAVRRVMADAGDTSWDVVEIQKVNGVQTGTRPRSPERPAARKAKFAVASDALEILTKRLDTLVQNLASERHITTKLLEAALATQKKITEAEKADYLKVDLIEVHESIELTLRAYNDIIYDTGRSTDSNHPGVITKEEKKFLNKKGLRYINDLLSPLESLSQAGEAARQRALLILSPQEREICQALHNRLLAGRHARDTLQHPAPDTATAFTRIQDAAEPNAQVLHAFLATNPKRIKGHKEPIGTPLELFAKAGTYIPASQLKEKWDASRRKQEELEQLLAARRAKGAEEVEEEDEPATSKKCKRAGKEEWDDDEDESEEDESEDTGTPALPANATYKGNKGKKVTREKEEGRGKKVGAKVKVNRRIQSDLEDDEEDEPPAKKAKTKTKSAFWIRKAHKARQLDDERVPKRIRRRH